MVYTIALGALRRIRKSPSLYTGREHVLLPQILQNRFVSKAVKRITTKVVVFLLLFVVVVSPITPALAGEGSLPTEEPALQEMPSETVSEEVATTPQAGTVFIDADSHIW